MKYTRRCQNDFNIQGWLRHGLHVRGPRHLAPTGRGVTPCLSENKEKASLFFIGDGPYKVQHGHDRVGAQGCLSVIWFKVCPVGHTT
jgi:hypothetical protein